MLNGETLPSQLCVVQGRFSHDQYVLSVNGSNLKAIDDETTKGVASTYQNRPLTLKCDPISEGNVETGRNCVVRLDNKDLMKVLVTFE